MNGERLFFGMILVFFALFLMAATPARAELKDPLTGDSIKGVYLKQDVCGEALSRGRPCDFSLRNEVNGRIIDVFDFDTEPTVFSLEDINKDGILDLTYILLPKGGKMLPCYAQGKGDGTFTKAKVLVFITIEGSRPPQRHDYRPSLQGNYTH